MIVGEILLASAVTAAVLVYVVPIVVGLGSILLGMILGYFLSKKPSKDEYDIESQALLSQLAISSESILSVTDHLVSDLTSEVNRIVLRSGSQEQRLDSALDLLASNIVALNGSRVNLSEYRDQRLEIADNISYEPSSQLQETLIHELLLENQALSDLIVRVAQTSADELAAPRMRA